MRSIRSISTVSIRSPATSSSSRSPRLTGIRVSDPLAAGISRATVSPAGSDVGAAAVVPPSSRGDEPGGQRREQQQRGGEQEQAARDHAIEHIPAIPVRRG